MPTWIILQAFQVANLVKEYTEVLQAAPKEKEVVRRRENKRNGSARPVSILHKPVPVIESAS